MQDLGGVFPSMWAEGELKEMLEKGEGADAMLKWFDENVTSGGCDNKEFVQRMTRLFLEFIITRAKSAGGPDKVLSRFPPLISV